MSFVLQSLIFMAARQKIMMTAKTLDRMRLCFKTKVRFSEALRVAHRIYKEKKCKTSLSSHSC